MYASTLTHRQVHSLHLHISSVLLKCSLQLYIIQRTHMAKVYSLYLHVSPVLLKCTIQ